MNKIIITFLIGLTFISCIKTSPERDNYPKNKILSNIQGIPNDCYSYYLPASIQTDSISTNTEIDAFMQTWFSSTLYAAKEPILFNYYLGHDIYRFLWLRSFNRPVIFTIHKDKNLFWLITKVLEKEPEFSVPVKNKPKSNVILEENSNIELYKLNRSDSIPNIQTKGEAKIVFNEKRTLSQTEWIEFENRLNSASFWTAKPYIPTSGCDGSEWTIEAHLKEKYWFVIRWTPEDNFRKAGEFLIEKSELKETIY